jgi:hypothetical protein
MSYTNGLDKPEDYFNTKLYTGNGSTQSITGVGFQPDMTWVKSRTTGGSGNNNHCINDVVRAKGTYGYPMIHPNLTASEYDPDSGNEVITDFQSDGFDLGGNENSNFNTATYASWNWKANGTGASNTDGDITSTVSANTTSGFSIVSYTGTGSAATVGHGLGVTPSMYIVKNRSDNDSWGVYHKSLGATQFLRLQATDASATSSVWWNDTEPTSSVFSVGTAVATNASGENLIAYCFAELKGFSKFGSYTGNGSADGTFVYTGFKPAFVLIKSSSLSQDWFIHDNKRSTFNVSNTVLLPNTVDLDITDTTVYGIDMVSNGFKVRGTHARINQSGSSYIYMAFAENSFVTSTGIPTTAR